MILSDTTILQEINKGTIKIEVCDLKALKTIRQHNVPETN